MLTIHTHLMNTYTHIHTIHHHHKCHHYYSIIYVLWLLVTGTALANSFILSHSVLIYLSIYVCAQSRQMPRLLELLMCAGLVSSQNPMVTVYVVYFPAHCAGVTNMSAHSNLSSL